MEIKKLCKETQHQANILFNSVAQGEVVHRKLDEKRFEEQFITETETVKKINLVAMEGESVVGFANASYKADTNVGYITFVVVKKEYRRNGIGRKLLRALEQELDTVAGAPLPKYDITFFNPINLEWIVPNTKEHDHPNAPGVDVASDGYIFLKNCGYRDTVYQNSFYQPLENFEAAPEIKERIEKLKNEQEITITYYDKTKHYGLDELFTDLGSELWRETIMNNVNQPDGGYPVLIAEHKGKAVGFTGPLYVQTSGRGYFAGIGVHSEYRKYGLGKALFTSLCLSLKEMGAGYMTLFTGETNPARNIYESAGFKIVKTWADMERVKR
jgi:ribosomal protein S18 acetylase RimI-like enzyme